VKRAAFPWLALVTLLLAYAAVVLIGTYTFLPPLIEGAVARSVQDRLGLEETPGVELERGPPPEMLAGRFSGAGSRLEARISAACALSRLPSPSTPSTPTFCGA
jgi:hypothetical protein